MTFLTSITSAPVRLICLLIGLFTSRSPWPLVEMNEKITPKGPHDDPDTCVELVTNFPGSKEVAGKRAYAGIDTFFSEYGWAVEASFVAMHTRRLVHAYIALRIVIGTMFFMVLRS